MRVIWAVLVIASILIFALVLSQNSEALKSEGNSLTEVSSKKVCGISLCDEPMSIAEKISLYLQKLSGSESTVLQQAIDPRLMIKEPLKIKPGTTSLREALSAKQFEQAKVREVVPTAPAVTMEAIRTAPSLGSLESLSAEPGIGTLPTDIVHWPIVFGAPYIDQGSMAYVVPDKWNVYSSTDFGIGIQGTINGMHVETTTGSVGQVWTATLIYNRQEMEMQCSNTDEPGSQECTTFRNPVFIHSSGKFAVKLDVPKTQSCIDTGHTGCSGTTPIITLFFAPAQ